MFHLLDIKKLNVFLGSNASGKTSLIQTIWQILFFFKSGDKNVFTSLINMKVEESYVEVDLGEDSQNRHFLHRFKIKTNNKDKDNIDIKISQTFVKLSSAKSSKDSYESKVKDLNKKKKMIISIILMLLKTLIFQLVGMLFACYRKWF